MSSLPITVEFPIKQVVSGRAGVFNVDLMELKAMNMEDFANYDKKNSQNCGNTPEERERKFWRSLGYVTGVISFNNCFQCSSLNLSKYISIHGLQLPRSMGSSCIWS